MLYAEALLLVAEKGVPGQSYNIGGRNEYTNIAVVKAICALLDELAPDASIGRRENLIAFVADRPGHDARYAIDAEAISAVRGDGDFDHRVIRAECGYSRFTNFCVCR